MKSNIRKQQNIKIKQLKKQLATVNQQNTQLKKTITYLEDIISMMPGHVYWFDRNNNFLGCNLNQAKTFHLKSWRDVIGKRISDFQSNKNTIELEKINNEVMRRGKMLEREETGYRANGKKEGVYVSYKKPLFDKNKKVIGLLGISFDITEKKELEKKLLLAKEDAEAANIAKTEFIANISHDIRTPLSGIIGMTQLLQQSIKDRTEKKYLSNILESAKQLLHLLNDIIEFSKVELKSLPIRSEAFNLKKTIIDAARLLSKSKKRHSIQFKITYPQNIPQVIIGDSIRINRIILNLLNNAYKFTKEGQIKVIVKKIQSTKSQLSLQIAVQDTGIGIPEDKFNEVFDRFFRLSSTYKGSHQGTGLGLTIVKQFVNDLKGSIKIESELGVGTKFIIDINFKKFMHKIKKQDRMKETLIPHISKKKLSILLVEDNKICQLAEKILLQRIGHNVDTVNTGKEALNKLTKKYDLIISDIGLPDIDGALLASKIRQHKNYKTTPIIALTAHVSEKNTNKFLQQGINATLHKPMDLDEIKETINKLIYK